MSDMLTQAEIDALLNGTSGASSDEDGDKKTVLSPEEIDAIGEIGNISMGTSATTLFTLLGYKVTITTPRVEVTNWTEMAKDHSTGYVAVKVEFTDGMKGTNLLLLKEKDVKIIADIMMGGDGKNVSGELGELHLSAISEAMNQMIGSAATSMSSMFNKKINISPPTAFVLDYEKVDSIADFSFSDDFVKVSFNMVVGDLIDSIIMQILPVSFAKCLVSNLLNASAESAKGKSGDSAAPMESKQQAQANINEMARPHVTPPNVGEDSFVDQSFGASPRAQNNIYHEAPPNKIPVNVQPAQFQSFDDNYISVDKKNIGLIMDVPLQVTVELGRTNKLIREILELAPGSVIELDKIAGEPVDILVNGKAVAKGEVVVIDESFGVRVTDILHPSKRL